MTDGTLLLYVQNQITNAWMIRIHIEQCHALFIGISTIFKDRQCQKTSVGSWRYASI